MVALMHAPRGRDLKLLTLILFLALFSACGIVQRPTASSPLGPGFTHPGIVADCANCHGTGQPFAKFPASGHPPTRGQDCGRCHNTTAWLAANPHTAGAPIPNQCASCHLDQVPLGLQGSADISQNLTPTGGFFDHVKSMGNNDCALCHTSVPANVGVTWSGGTYPHEASLTSCNVCHTSVQQPVGGIGNPPFDHVNATGQDCFACHGSTPADFGVTWAQGHFPHSPTPTACASCHAGDSAYTAVQGTIVSQMNHGFSGIGDCAACHTSAASASGWASWHAESVANGTSTPRASLGVFHAAMSATPGSCQTCHANERPPGQVGAVGLVGNLTPTGGYFDHSANGGSGDCVGCHLGTPGNVGKTWQGGIFGHNPIPGACLGCHTVSQMPSGSVGNPPFDHATIAGQDCVNCHVSVPANVGKVWSTGTWSHSPVPTSCATCHASDSTYTSIQTTITKQMNHAYGGLGDCAACHTSAASASGWTSWQAESVANGNSAARGTLGIFHANAATPGTCQICHANERPASNVGTPPFSHSLGGTGDCAACHAAPANVGLTWVGGQYSHSPAPSTCTTCHAADSAYTSIQSTVTNQMNHAFPGLPDCATCHASGAAGNHYASWNVENISNSSIAALASPGVYHSAMTPTACAQCHASLAPQSATTDVHGNAVPAHTAAPYTGECNACHTAPGTDWTVATAAPSVVTLNAWSSTNSATNHKITMSHPASNTYTSCTQCHSGGVYTKVVDYNHSGLTSNVTVDGVTVTQPNLGSTAYNASTNPTFCAMCHEPSSPYVTSNPSSVTVVASFTAGSTAITPSSAMDALVVGMTVTGSGLNSMTLTGCSLASGSTTVTCASTANLVTGLTISGTGASFTRAGVTVSSTTVSSVTSATTFVTADPAAANATGLTLTAKTSGSFTLTAIGASTFTVSKAALVTTTNGSLSASRKRILQMPVPGHGSAVSGQDCTSCHYPGGSAKLTPPTAGVFSTGNIAGP